MSETKAVKETRRWRRAVHEQTRNLTPSELRAHEDEVLRAARASGAEFEDVVDMSAATTGGPTDETAVG